jgi:hypothetical protein
MNRQDAKKANSKSPLRFMRGVPLQNKFSFFLGALGVLAVKRVLR